MNNTTSLNHNAIEVIKRLSNLYRKPYRKTRRSLAEIAQIAQCEGLPCPLGTWSAETVKTVLCPTRDRAR